MEKSVCNEKLPYIDSDNYDIKKVDRKLSYSFVNSSFKICDVGGGWGIDALQLAKRGDFVVLLDINRVVLQYGKILARENSIMEKIDFLKATATNLPLKNGSFDLITCFSVLDHLPNKKSAFQAICEISRTIRSFGYVAITVPNKLFLFGTISMKIKFIMESDALFEQRFTPKELHEILRSSGLTPLVFDSKYPTKIGSTILKYNLPRTITKVPGFLLLPLLLLVKKIFDKLNRLSWLKMLGARIGYLSRKIP